MTVEESSSQDATLIDDDLVAALGFEPVIEVSTDAPAEESDAEDTVIATNGSTDHHVADAPVEDASATSIDIDNESNGVFVEAEAALDEVALDDDVSEASAADVGSFDQVASVVADEVADDLTAPVDVVDLDHDVVDLDHDEADAIEEESDAIEEESADLIDLDQVDLTDAPAIEEEISTLADADTVFADADTVLADADTVFADSDTVFADVDTVFDVEADVTETVPLVQPSEEVIGAGAVATAATAAEKRSNFRRLRARKTRRVVRHIDPWSVLTFSVLFHMVVFAALLLSSVLVWNAAIASGMVENVESFIQELGDYETFEINADVMFRAAIVIAGMLTLASSVLVVLLTVVFNLISDLVGGIRVTVIEEETVRVPLDKTRGKATNE